MNILLCNTLDALTTNTKNPAVRNADVTTTDPISTPYIPILSLLFKAQVELSSSEQSALLKKTNC